MRQLMLEKDNPLNSIDGTFNHCFRFANFICKEFYWTICKLVNLKRAKCVYHMLMSNTAWFIVAILLAGLKKKQESQSFFSS